MDVGFEQGGSCCDNGILENSRSIDSMRSEKALCDCTSEPGRVSRVGSYLYYLLEGVRIVVRDCNVTAGHC